MKPFLLPLALCLLLCGCAPQNPPPEETLSSPPPVVTQPESPSAAPDFILDTDSSGSLFSLSEAVNGVLPLGDNLLFFSGTEYTTLTLVDTNTHTALATHETGMVLMPENATVQSLNTGISYFNGPRQETVVLDESLREIQRIPAPENLSGMPLLSPDGRTMYYCTPSAIRALDLDTGISRVLKEASYPVQGLSGLLWGDAILQLSITEQDGTWRTMYLSGETGQLLQEQEGNPILRSMGEGYFLHGRLNNLPAIVYGDAEGTPRVLHPRLDAEDVFCLTDSIATTGWENGNLILDFYSPDTGLRTASFPVSAGQFPQTLFQTADGSFWVLWTGEDGQASHLQQITPVPVQDDSIYAVPYHTRKYPDYDGLAACSVYAQELSEKHGINILVYKDAVALEPWDYHLNYEYQTPVLRRELDALDARLSSFPAGFLQTLRDKFTGLTICIVRSVEGSPESGSLTAANGIQFMDGFDAYIVLATSHDTEYALYHELSHLMETLVLTESTAYDRWSNLNPPDFQYDYDLSANQHRDGSSWLKEGSQYFIDTYSMFEPKEDRARLFEYAMTPGHEDLFHSPNLQQKLRQLCIGIREGFGLENAEEQLPWEQYLAE